MNDCHIATIVDKNWFNLLSFSCFIIKVLRTIEITALIETEIEK